MQRIAIYDLDKTILKTPTFTAFLVFCARENGRSLAWRAPVWIAALIGYKLGFYGRKPMKQFGIRLFIGQEIPKEKAADISRTFAATIIPSDVQLGASAAIAADRAAGRRIVIATAANEFYVREIAVLLGIEDIIATRNLLAPCGSISHLIEGENCYAEEKLARVKQWIAEQKIDRAACQIRFYSDHHSDAAMLDWADEGVLVGQGEKMRHLAVRHDWQLADFG